MILNTQIFTATVAAAKAAANDRPDVLRAIDRAVVEITKSPYWSFADGILTIQSTTSNMLYRVDAAHTCEARTQCCKHRVARLLMVRYTERLASAPTTESALAQRLRRLEVEAIKAGRMRDAEHFAKHRQSLQPPANA